MTATTDYADRGPLFLETTINTFLSYLNFICVYSYTLDDTDDVLP